ncbi:nucleotidyltransferase family protein [Desulfocucumis palustris]|uniref:nucleotidyltransferase family protein n=1 Tax=Desulfocucumis palustris TaxID=1898651 RepID=UPI0013FDDB18|nr:nucleotidyltransferase family protein [Desulfocucumis palustris]
MKAVVLAGGFGTRLQSVLKGLPKPMAPVGEGCFLDYLLKGLISSGIKEYIFCVYYLADKITGYLGDGGKLGISVDYSVETRPMGTAGAVGLLRESLKETFCVVNADTYIEVDLRECLQWHREKKAMATLCAVKVADSGRFGTLVFDSRWRIIDFREKAASGGNRWINGGIYIFEPEIFQYIPEGTSVSMEREVFPRLLKSRERIYGYPRETHFFDIGVPEDYYAFQEFISWKREKGDI